MIVSRERCGCVMIGGKSLICKAVYGWKSSGWSWIASGSLITRYCVVGGRKLMRWACG